MYVDDRKSFLEYVMAEEGSTIFVMEEALKVAENEEARKLIKHQLGLSKQKYRFAEQEMKEIKERETNEFLDKYLADEEK